MLPTQSVTPIDWDGLRQLAAYDHMASVYPTPPSDVLQEATKTTQPKEASHEQQ
jgi:hypothetical protein